ncbi:HD domain-containing phosphohydrolase [Mycoplasmatota bacterium zrk1]
MKRHVSFGYDNTTGFDKVVRKGVIEHHENYDDFGYPAGLKGNDIRYADQ